MVQFCSGLSRIMWITMFCLFAAGHCLGLEELKPPELKVSMLKARPPVIDGTLDDEAWKDAAEITDFRLADGTLPRGKCRCKVVRDDQKLYVSVEALEPGDLMKKVKTSVTKHDGDVWNDDDIELFIDPSGKRRGYYQIIVNSKGITFDAYYREAKVPDASWEPAYDVKTCVGPDGWTAEFALPWACFDRTEKSADTWAFNVVRERSIGEELYWATVYGESSHDPSRFGKLLEMPSLTLPAVTVKDTSAAENKK